MKYIFTYILINNLTNNLMKYIIYKPDDDDLVIRANERAYLLYLNLV